MAIAFSHQGAAQLNGGTSLPATVIINTNDTVVVYVIDDTDEAFVVTDDAAGGSNAYTKIGVSQGVGPFLKVFIAGPGAKAATTVTAAQSDVPSAEGIAVAAITYTGVVAIGLINGASNPGSTTASVVQTTTGANNFIAAAYAWFNGATTSATASVGNLRVTLPSSLTLLGVAAGDNTAATPSAVTNAITLSATSGWGAISIELRSTASSSNPNNQQPILVPGLLPSWKAAQTLYASAAQAVGIRPQKIVWTGRTASSSNSFLIRDPRNLATLMRGASVDGAAPRDMEYDFENIAPTWRDFEVATLTSGTLLIYYRV